MSSVPPDPEYPPALPPTPPQPGSYYPPPGSYYPPPAGYPGYPGYPAHIGDPANPAPIPAYSPYPPGYNVYPGYPVYPTPARLRSTNSLRTATIVLFWCVVGASLLLTIAFFARRGTWDDWRQGAAPIDDLHNADDFVAGMAAVQVLIELAAVIVLSLWSRRVVANAQARGALGVSPGLACGGWYIPFGWYIVGFDQLRKAVNAMRGSAPMLLYWQISFAAASLVAGVASVVISGATDADTASDVAGRLTAQSVVGLIASLGLLASAALATQALRQIDRAVSGA